MDKHCNKCNTTKPINEFGKDKTHKDGNRSVCKSCIKKYMEKYGKTDEVKEKRRKRYKENQEKMRAANKKNREKNGWKWNETRKRKHKENPLIMMHRQAKARAKRKKLKFDLSINDLQLPSICPVLGIPIYVSETGKPTNNSPTLDRIDNTKGYIKNNVIVVSFKANTIKNAATIEDLKKVFSYYEKNHELL